jgi:predicted dehydrogenase
VTDVITSSGDDLDIRPEPRSPSRLGIGIVGSGAIVDNSHLPAYRSAGFRVAAITSRTQRNAQRVADRHSIPRVHKTVDQLLTDPDVDIVDIALPPDYQPDIVHKAIAAGKHVLAQKPLAVDYREAVSMVTAAESAGIRLAVNQNGRFDPSMNAAHTLIGDGILGTRLVATINTAILNLWQEYLREARYRELIMLHFSVHHMDQIRMLFGEPDSVVAIGRTTPGGFHGETIAQYILRYPDGFWVSGLDDGTNWSTDFGITYRIQGTDASIRGEIGWPHNRQSSLAIQLRGTPDWIAPAFTRKWFPDAFAATMASLIVAIERNEEPAISGRDNLGTLRTVFAAYRSMRENRAVAPSEIDDQ